MNENNPFRDVLAKAVELMETIQNHKGPIKNLTSEQKKEIEELSKQWDELKSVSQKHIEDFNVDPEAVRIDAMRSPEVSDKDKKLFTRATRVKRDSEVLKNTIKKKLSKKKPNKLAGVKKKAASNEQMKERRKRFKPIGGDKNWIPL